MMSSSLCLDAYLDPYLLTARQQEVLTFIQEVHRVTGEPCSARLVARRMDISLERVRHIVVTLHRKGFLRSASDRAQPRKPFLAPR
jgi:hypothetical protein